MDRIRRNPDAGFYELATESLAHHRDEIMQRAEEFPSWIFQTDALPIQMYPRPTFGDLPITLVRNERYNFCIDVYLWNDSDTTIHDHAFSGSFLVASGQSFQSRYQFETEHVVQQDHLELGNLRLLSNKIETTGAITPIIAGERFVHSVIHLSRPTTSFLIRTSKRGETSPKAQYTYESNYRFRGGEFFQPTEKKIQYTKYMLDHGLPYDVEGIFRGLSPYDFVRLANILHTYPGGTERLDQLVDRFLPIHGEWVAHILDSMKTNVSHPQFKLLKTPETILLGALLSKSTSLKEVQATMRNLDSKYDSMHEVMGTLRSVCEMGFPSLNLPDLAFDILELHAKGHHETQDIAKHLIDYGWEDSTRDGAQIVGKLNQVMKKMVVFRTFYKD